MDKKIDVDVMEFVQIVKDTKNHKNKGLKKGISLTFKQNKICDSKTKTQESKIRTWDVQNRCENEYLFR